MGVMIGAVYVVCLTLYFIVAFKYRIGCYYDPVTATTFNDVVAGDFYR
jgi:hypothetical protein